MGTETIRYIFLEECKNKLYVKLNNPLMGTETSDCNVKLLLRTFIPVKLNNPLMGTETGKVAK